MVELTLRDVANEKQVFAIVNQMYWHLEQIKKQNYQISQLDLDDLKEAEGLLNNITPYYGRK